MSRILIKNLHTLVTLDGPDPVLSGASLLIEDGKIASLGPFPQLPAADETLDGRNLIALPGFVNTHHHLYQTLQRNVPRVQNAELFDWLTGLYQIWQELTPEAVYVSAQIGLAELLLTGCTTTTDHFYVFPRGQKAELLDEEIRAAQELGLRFHPTRGSMSLGQSQGGLPPDEVVQTEAEILMDCERLVDKYHDPGPFSMCRIALAPCSPFSVTPDLMKEAAAYARSRQLRLHTHLAETLDEEQFCLERFGKRPLDYMEGLGWIGPDVWFAHGIHFNDAELQRLADTQTGVAHCPHSNLRLGSGIARVPEMLQRGVPVGIGVDGSASNDASNMLSELRMALLIHRLTQGVRSTNALQVFRMACQGGAKLLGWDTIGTLAPGQAADIVLFDLNKIGYAGAMHDPVAALLFCGTSQEVHTAIVNGRILIRQGEFLHFDAEKTIARANQLAAGMIRKASQRTGLDFLQPNP